MSSTFSVAKSGNIDMSDLQDALGAVPSSMWRGVIRGPLSRGIDDDIS